MKKICVGLLVLVFATTATFGQQQGIGIKAGEKELSGSFSIMQPSEGDTGSMWMILGSAGYFLTSQIQLKGVGMIFGTKDMTSGIVGAGGDYLFGANVELIPYIGAGIMTSVGDLDMGLLLDVHGGIKQFISERTAINYEVKYMMSSKSDSESGSGLLMGTVGLSFYFM